MAAEKTVSLIHIHDEKTAEAVSPAPTDRFATMNISDVPESSDRYAFWILMAARMTTQNSTPSPMSSP